jgi:hypothetical protein
VPGWVFRRRKALLAQGFCDNWRELGGDGGDFGWLDVYETSVLAAVLELNDSADLGEEGVVLAAAYVGTGLERCATLAHDDAAAEDGLAAEFLYSQPLSV